VPIWIIEPVCDILYVQVVWPVWIVQVVRPVRVVGLFRVVQPFRVVVPVKLVGLDQVMCLSGSSGSLGSFELPGPFGFLGSSVFVPVQIIEVF